VLLSRTTLPRLGLALALASCLAAGSLVLGRGAAAGPVDERPNVVVIMTDDQDYASLRVMDRTQRLITRKGVKFTRHYATFPLCCPSRASYLTGQYAHNHGVRDNKLPNGGVRVFDDSATSVVALDAAGYETAWIGKYLNGYPGLARENPTYIPPGFDRWFAGVNTRMFNWSVDDEGTIRRFGHEHREYQTDVYTRQARRFIEQTAVVGTPFFLTLAPAAPHGEPSRTREPNPRPAPRHRDVFSNVGLPKTASFNERDVSDKPTYVQRRARLDPGARERVRSRLRARLGSVLAIDDMVAGVVEELREDGEMQNTYVFFTSDNGYLGGEHRLVGKDVLYEESARVPLIVRGPGIPARRKHESPTGNIDLAPTIYEIAEASAATTPDGVSLLPVATDPGVQTGRGMLLSDRAGSEGVQDGRFVYIENPTQNGTEFELYNLDDDPHQLDNLHLLDQPNVRPGLPPALEERRDELADLLDDLRGCQGSGCN
jgi:N-acetylglucosamine-6-sulfatase